LRFPVARLLGLLAAGEPRERILQTYPYLEPEDIEQALQYGAQLADDETVELVRRSSRDRTAAIFQLAQRGGGEFREQC
jgi:uncharacterized protein DUF433